MAESKYIENLRKTCLHKQMMNIKGKKVFCEECSKPICEKCGLCFSIEARDKVA